MTSISKKAVKLKEYISAACLANTPFWITLLALSYINLESSTLFSCSLGFLTVFGGTTLAGFLVAGKLARNHIKTGIVTGLSSYIVHIVSVTWLFGDVMFLKGPLGDLLLILVFIIGGIFGSVIRKNLGLSKQVTH